MSKEPPVLGPAITNQFSLEPVEFDYLNHRGVVERRRIIPESISLDCHPGYGYQPGWFLNGFCLDRKARRSFALTRFALKELPPGGYTSLATIRFKPCSYIYGDD